MARVVKSTIIDAPVDRVWAILRDFNGFDRWLPPIKASAIERHLPADLIGCVRRVQLQDGAEVREQLLGLSDLEMTFSYCLLDTPIRCSTTWRTCACCPSPTATAPSGTGRPDSRHRQAPRPT